MGNLSKTEKDLITALVNALKEDIQDLFNEEQAAINKSGQANEANASKIKGSMPGSLEDKTANFLHNRIADNL